MAAEAGQETRRGAESDEESDGCDGAQDSARVRVRNTYSAARLYQSPPAPNYQQSFYVVARDDVLLAVRRHEPGGRHGVAAATAAAAAVTSAAARVVTQPLR